MFDLITGNIERPLRERSPLSKLVAAILHVCVVSVVIVIPILMATNTMPEVPTIMAFATPAVEPPPPPPPAPPRAAAARAAEPIKTSGQSAVPIEAPSDIRPEAPGPNTALDGVEGGVPGGVSGGIVGGLVTPAAPPPRPPPLPPAPRAPVRIGGQMLPPTLVHRVEPEYPTLLASAQISGMVILEALVDTEGCVQSVKVLRGLNPIFDKAAVDALTQWQYSPLALNGIPTSFVLTVTFNFSVQQR